MFETGKHNSLNRTALRWTGLVSCALYLIVASDMIYALPVEWVSATIEALEVDQCADMVCAVRVNDEGKSICCCNPDGEDAKPEPTSGLCVLKDCSSPQDREGTLGSKTTKPTPQPAESAQLFIPAALEMSDCSQSTLRPPHADVPDKIPL